MSAMSRIYANLCENGKNFYTVSKKLQPEVRELIEADGYIIKEDGTVVPAPFSEILEG